MAEEASFGTPARELASELVRWRRQIHRRPELAYRERETAALVASILEGLGIGVRSKVGGTGVVGLLEGELPGPTVALRADMDALPVPEETGLEFASELPGVMHACGHDAHVAMLLGAAHLLRGRRDRLPGSVKFLFQPAEEMPPGGARAMLEDGALENPTVEAALALHVDPYLPVGIMGWREGVTMAAVDTFRLEIIGRGGHSATPHLAVDAILVAATVIQSLQALVSRQNDPFCPFTLNVGTIAGGYKDNVIADRVVMEGTARTLDQALRAALPGRMEAIVKGITGAFGASYKLNYCPGYPPLNNDRETLEVLKEAAALELGAHSLFSLARPSLGGEDFALIAGKVPSAYAFLGAAGAGELFPWHHPRFHLDEAVLPLGAAVLAQAAFLYLNKKAGGTP